MEGAHHPDLNPFTLPQNAECRMDYRKDMCPQSLDILQRTVSIGLRPDLAEEEINSLINGINTAG